jgi:3-oxoacyl-[acyl-carrier protein] reductase
MFESDLSFGGRTASSPARRTASGAIALAFAERGASVWACDVVEDELRETGQILSASGRGTCTTRAVDVTDKRAVEALVAEPSAPSGRVDILVNNAGGVLGQVGRPLEDVSETDWQKIFDVNVTAAFLCAQAVSPGMKAARHGRIINIRAVPTRRQPHRDSGVRPAKAAQIGLTRQLAHELGPWGSR